MPEELGFSGGELILMGVIVVCFTILCVFWLIQRRKEPDKPPRPEITTIVLLFGIVGCLTLVYQFGLTEWNPFEHPWVIIALGVGIFLVQIFRLRALKEKSFEELLALAVDYMRDQNLQLSSASNYNHVEMAGRVRESPDESVMYMLFNAKDVSLMSTVKVLLGLFTGTGGLAYYQINPRDEIIRDIERRVKVPEYSPFRAIEKYALSGEEQAEAVEE